MHFYCLGRKGLDGQHGHVLTLRVVGYRHHILRIVRRSELFGQQQFDLEIIRIGRIEEVVLGLLVLHHENDHLTVLQEGRQKNLEFDHDTLEQDSAHESAPFDLMLPLQPSKVNKVHIRLRDTQSRGVHDLKLRVKCILSYLHFEILLDRDPSLIGSLGLHDHLQ